MPHIHEKYDFVVSLLIVYAGRVLLVDHPRYDKWLSPQLKFYAREAIAKEREEKNG